MTSTLSKILLMRTDRIGDVILTAPAATALKQAFPGIHISFLARSYTRPLLEMHRDVDEVIVYDPEQQHRGFVGHLRLASELRSRQFDAAILCRPRPALASAIFLAEIPKRIGIGYRWYSLFLNQRIYEHRKHGGRHELDYNLSFLKPLIEGQLPTPEFHFDLPESLQEWQNNILTAMGIPGKYAIIHPGNGGSAPNLSAAQYRLAIQTLLNESEMSVVLTGSPAEEEWVSDIIGPSIDGRVINAAGEFSIEQLMGMIDGASLFISSSTGPFHMAGALNVPLIGFYCPAPPCAPHRWGPYLQPDWAITPDVTPCDHCRPEKCDNGNCLLHIPDQAIIDAIRKRLAFYGST